MGKLTAAQRKKRAHHAGKARAHKRFAKLCKKYGLHSCHKRHAKLAKKHAALAKGKKVKKEMMLLQHHHTKKKKAKKAKKAKKLTAAQRKKRAFHAGKARAHKRFAKLCKKYGLHSCHKRHAKLAKKHAKLAKGKKAPMLELWSNW